MNKKPSIMVTAALGISLAAFPVYAQKGPQRAGDKTGQQQQRQRNRSGQHQRMGMENRFAKGLNLTDAQKSKINPILKKQGEQLRAIHNNTKLTPEQRREQSKKLFAALPGKINKYLTETQQKKLKEMMDRRRNFEGRRKGDWGRKPGTSPKRN